MEDTISPSTPVGFSLKWSVNVSQNDKNCTQNDMRITSWQHDTGAWMIGNVFVYVPVLFWRPKLVCCSREKNGRNCDLRVFKYPRAHILSNKND